MEKFEIDGKSKDFGRWAGDVRAVLGGVLAATPQSSRRSRPVISIWRGAGIMLQQTVMGEIV